MERAGGAIKTKKGKYAWLDDDDLHVYSTGYWDKMVFSATHERAGRIFRSKSISITPPANFGNLMARFMLKMGLELLTFSDDIDSFSSIFDNARRCARYGQGAEQWNVSYGLYPRRGDLALGIREDEIGPLETRQIYEYSLGVMPSGRVTFCFVFFNHIFACNLIDGNLDEYIDDFNKINEYSIHGRW